LFNGLSAGEVATMLSSRRRRVAVWLLVLGAAALTACYVQVERTASGTFAVRPLLRAEIHAPVAGFLREIPLDEGERVSPAGLIVRLDVPDLESKLAQKR